jgi:hypothetical protein
MGRRWRATLLEIAGGMLALVEKDKKYKLHISCLEWRKGHFENNRMDEFSKMETE